MADRDELLTIEQVSRWTGLALPTLYAMRSRGEGPASFKIGSGRSGRIRYRQSSVEEWLQFQEQAEAYRLARITG